MLRRLALVVLTAPLTALAGCGYHKLGAATHLWQDVEPAITYQAAFPWDSSIELWKRKVSNGRLPEFLGDRVAHLALYQR